MWILGVAAVLLVALFLLALLCLHIAFGARCEGDQNLKYLTHRDFAGLEAEPVEFCSARGKRLCGAVYTHREIAEPVGLVVFAHGMGGGHRSYMTEINTFARGGFAVLAYDNTGTMASEGEALGSFYQAARDLRAALAFVRESKKWSGYPLLLSGHSWGGYAVCQALAYEEAYVAGAAAFSAPDSAALAVCDSLQTMAGIPMGWMRPFFAAASIVQGGWDARRSTTAVLARTSRVPVLLLQGDADTSVRLKNSPVSRAAVRDKKNIRTVVYEGRSHNVYQTRESEQYLGKTMGAINAAKKKYGKAGIPEEEKRALYAIDYELITREDPDVMQTVLDFMRTCVQCADQGPAL